MDIEGLETEDMIDLLFDIMNVDKLSDKAIKHIKYIYGNVSHDSIYKFTNLLLEKLKYSLQNA